MKFVVIGGGIAGLCAGLRLSARHDVVVIERSAAPGGKIRSQHIDGFRFDWGPNGFLSSATELCALVGELGLEDALIAVDSTASKRSIYWNGRLHTLPAKPPHALTMSLLSPLGKLRALCELAVPARTQREGEDVYGFFARRFGREVAERIVAPALLGISGGDARATSIEALFPRLPEFESERGSVIRGMMQTRAKPGKLMSFSDGGMERLTDSLARKLGDRLRLGCEIERIEPRGSGWCVYAREGEIEADGVVLATPSNVAATLVEGFDVELARLLRTIDYAPMRVVGVAFRAEDVPVPLDGFGFLAARGQGVRILGALYTSTMYPDQAPAGTAYLRVFLGGATDPAALALDAASARAIVRADLATTLRITGEPVAYHEVLWPHAIPQYALGHRALLANIDERSTAHGNFAMVGNAYRGVGVGDTVRTAFAAAERLGS
jgi:oxygen-dependent protoporphyrinogen oxidase